MVAELLHRARRERGLHGGRHGTRLAAVVTGHAGLRREHRRTRKTMIGAGRALADRTENEVGGHDASLASPRFKLDQSLYKEQALTAIVQILASVYWRRVPCPNSITARRRSCFPRATAKRSSWSNTGGSIWRQTQSNLQWRSSRRRRCSAPSSRSTRGGSVTRIFASFTRVRTIRSRDRQ